MFVLAYSLFPWMIHPQGACRVDAVPAASGDARRPVQVVTLTVTFTSSMIMGINEHGVANWGGHLTAYLSGLGRHRRALGTGLLPASRPSPSCPVGDGKRQ